MYTSILYVLDHCFYLPLNHLFLSTIVPEQLYCNEKVIFCYKQIDSTRIAGGFCVSGISIFRNTKNSNTLNRINPIRKKNAPDGAFFYASDLEYAFFIWLLSSNNTLSSVSSVSFCSIAAISAFACCRSAFLAAVSCSAAKRAS